MTVPKDDTEAMIRIAKKVQTVDSARAESDPFKLPFFLREDLYQRLESTEDIMPSTTSAEGKRLGASSSLKTAFEELQSLLKEGFRLVQATPRFQATEAQKVAALTVYGWTGAKLGVLSERTRVLTLARLALQETARITPETVRYPLPLVEQIQKQVTIIEQQEAAAAPGGRQTAVQNRNEARSLLRKALRRVRHYYCCASDSADETPELAKIGFQPVHRSGQRRVAGEPASAEVTVETVSA